MAESTPLLVIVMGPPASGKTYLGRLIATHFKLPYLNKDGLKELLFDSLGWKDATWSRQLNNASLNLLFHFTEAMLAAGCSHVLESNFKAEIDSEKFRALKEKYPFEPVQINCVAEGSVLVERFSNRTRHPGHSDAEILDYLRPVLLKGRMPSLDIGGSIIEVDTTDFAAIDYEALYKTIEEKLTLLSDRENT